MIFIQHYFLSSSVPLQQFCSISVHKFRLNSIMGTIPNSNSSQQPISFTQTQLNFLKWRSNPLTNSHIPRVKIVPKKQYSQKINYERIVQHMLNKQQFIDTQNISNGMKDQSLVENFVVFFEQYLCTVKDIENSLELAQNLYVLQCMLDGYQQIFNAFGKCIVENELCFVTFRGQIRCWINKHPSKNEFQNEDSSRSAGIRYQAEGYNALSSESAIVKRIIGSSYQLSNGNIGYLLFHEEIKQFLSENILLNSSFTSVKRFINHYLYTHRIFTQNKISITKISHALNGLKETQQEGKNSQRSSILSSDRSAVLSINQYQNSICESKKKEMPCKRMHNHSVSDDFSHFMESKQEKAVHYKQNIREQTITSTLENSKATKIRSKQLQQIDYFLKPALSKHGNSKLQRDTQRFGEIKKKEKLSVKNHHRKMSSLDEQNWALCLTPPFSDSKQFSVQSCHQYQYQQNKNEGNGDRRNQRYQSSEESLPSKLDSLENKAPFDKQCHTIFQSYESIHSLEENKRITGYKGKLAKMGRTVKIFHLPTGTKFSYTDLNQPKRQDK